jgi:antitoxin Phd
MATWQLQKAKAQLSKVIKKAAKEGPQTITVHGDPAVVVLSSEEYRRLKVPKESLVKFMRRSPLYGLSLNLSRSKTPARDVDLR